MICYALFCNVLLCLDPAPTNSQCCCSLHHLVCMISQLPFRYSAFRFFSFLVYHRVLVALPSYQQRLAFFRVRTGVVTVDVEEGPVQYVAHHIASCSVVVAGAKTISVADAATGKVRSCRPSKRALSGVSCATVEFPSGVTDDGKLKDPEKMDIIVQSDRSGDAEAIPLHVTPDTAGASRVLLGHTSAIITDVDVTPNDSHMFTCDREGKVRISALPFAHCIQSYLLGHEK